MPIQLIVTADDCGLSEGINQTVVDLHRQGIITTASVMTNFPAARHALELFRQQHTLEIGVHLNLSDGLPLTGIPSPSDLTRPDGQFRDRYILLARALFPPAAMLEYARAEMRAQIEVLLNAGLQPAHLTTHCHFHALPAMRDLVYALAEEYGVKWVRATHYRATSIPYNLLLDREARIEKGRSFIVPDYIVSLKQWVDKPVQDILAELLSLRGIVELVVHPGVKQNDETFPPAVRYSPQERYKETVFVEQLHRLLRHKHHDIVVSRLMPPDSR